MKDCERGRGVDFLENEDGREESFQQQRMKVDRTG